LACGRSGLEGGDQALIERAKAALRQCIEIDPENQEPYHLLDGLYLREAAHDAPESKHAENLEAAKEKKRRDASNSGSDSSQ
jgi:hypothetical protein